MMMRPLSSAQLLTVWEQGLSQPPTQRALTLLAAACPNTPLEVLARLNIGQRDAYLLTLREWTFGSQLVSLAGCPQCSGRLELTFDMADIRATPASSQPETNLNGHPAGQPLPPGFVELPTSTAELAESLVLTVAGYETRFRLPNSLDVVAAANCADLNEARQLLVDRCLLEVHQADATVSPAQLPAEVIDAIAAHMAQADPQAEVQLALTCPQCSHQWQVAFDIVSFFWSEINTWAYHLLRDIHTLAAVYGWSEADIIAMNPWRRQAYLDMVNE